MLQSDRSVHFFEPIKSQSTQPLFVYLPGMDGTGQLLSRQAEALGQFFSIRCLSIPRTDCTGWDRLANRVVTLLSAEQRLGPRRPVYLCGESFGGCLALKVVERSPQIVDYLILVNPASSLQARPWLQWGSYWLHVIPETLHWFSARALLPFLAALEKLTPGDRQALLEAMQSVPCQTAAWRLSLLREFQLSHRRLRQIHQPVLLIASAADRLLPSLAEAEHLSRYFPNTRRVVLPTSGHACLLETAVDLTEILRSQNFIPSQQPAATLLAAD